MSEVPDSSAGNSTCFVSMPRSKLPGGLAIDAEELSEVESSSSLPINLGQNNRKSDSHNSGCQKMVEWKD